MLSALKALLCGLVICLTLCLALLLQVATIGAKDLKYPVRIDPAPISSQPVMLHPGKELFARNCSPCHDIAYVVIGPALKGVFDRRDSLWVVNAILDFDLMLENGDSIATQLFNEYDQVIHLPHPFSDEDMRLLIEFIKEEEKRILPKVAYGVVACP